ncbi:hypothetical protein SSX86_005538 [Deinandra increscens subsp. villosa]|uniref:Uncharacterized protein n=1 Tax=Deinandra increscens subsp. villosa TaxID=3103831 RepID=A0AAP0HA58_9ASTR
MPKKNLATGETVSDLNPMCACDEKVVNNHENSESLPDCPSRGSHLDQLKATQENGTKNLSQTPDQRKSGRSGRKESVITSSPRLLRSRSQEKPKDKVNVSVDAPAQETISKEKKRRKMKKPIKEDHNNEFLKIKRHLRYLLNRMKYERNFIEAYAGEGWKGQSLEKLRPEKELERAKSDIHRYKLKIRELFKQIDASCEEGRIPETLYDSEGQIDSEDIFCAKCGQTEVRLDNDIILCDGACERGFHQFCLDPPLLKEQVPPGDEGWLCPACDCKADSIDLLNEDLGTDLSIEDNWEKVFPETAASGNILDDNLGLPSDDSEDDDYNPDGPQLEDKVDADHAEDSSSDESEFSSASEDLAAVANNEQFLGLPSEDSEDDDFNPDKVDSDEEAKMKSSASDFTSDSDDLGDIKNEVTSAEVQGLDKSGDKEELPESNTENDDFGPITAKRSVERLDYKKLHDETYGNISSDSDSSDEDFFDSEAPSRPKQTKGAKDTKLTKKQKQSDSTPVRKTDKKLDGEGTSDKSGSKSSVRKTGEAAAEVKDTKSMKKQKQNDSTPLKRTDKKLYVEGTSDKSGSKSSGRRIGEAAAQRLSEAFKENHYPDRDTREILVKELNLTHSQISKWFGNARWSFNHPEGRKKTVKSPAKPAENSTKQENKESPTTPKSRKRKTNADQQTGSSNQATRSSGRVQAKRIQVTQIYTSTSIKKHLNLNSMLGHDNLTPKHI